MSKVKNYKDISLLDYGFFPPNAQGQYSASQPDIETGCLQRIATATETMAEGFAAVLGKLEISEKRSDRFREMLQVVRQQRDKLERQVAGYKGQLAKMRKQIQKLKNGES
jgi:hypothetical protein